MRVPIQVTFKQKAIQKKGYSLALIKGSPLFGHKTNLFDHKTNLFGHKTLFDRDGLEKKELRAFGPQFFFSRTNFGAESVSPCAGRNFGENLRRRVRAKICAAV